MREVGSPSKSCAPKGRVGSIPSAGTTVESMSYEGLPLRHGHRISGGLVELAV